PEHEARLDDLRQRVDRRRVEHAPAGERALENGSIDERAHVVNDGIPAVHPDRIVAVALADRDQAGRDLVVGLLPADRLPSGRRTAHGASQALGVVMQLLQPVRLGTDEAARERVVLVATHPDDRLALDLDGEAAGGLAEWTDPVNDPAIRHLLHSSLVVDEGGATAASALPQARSSSMKVALAKGHFR